MNKIGIVMDPISEINYKKDSTLLLMHELQNQDKELFYINKDDNLITLKQKTQILEHKAYSEALIKVFRYN